ncbi:MAG TPA: D-alanine--D-alanine ligase [Bacteroidia bacterium]|nr:D-alanine--D-alanine ligase [Bacteroidia bacterium]HRH08410.1 D-alanine--D-alanine ligase [Bacteroidia bacterium]
MKIRIGILFGGYSKEREISFAGGRTVYDNLNKALFEAVPVFVDSFGNFILLNWEYVYKGSIRDFYPPANSIPAKSGDYQIYAESLGNLSASEQQNLTQTLGTQLAAEDFKEHFDFAFLCLHGPFGEDGKIQSILQSVDMPYSGSGIRPSQIGIDKALQKQLMKDAGFASPDFMVLEKASWLNEPQEAIFEQAKQTIQFPLVVKAATQGSSIGVSIISAANQAEFIKAVNKSFFLHELSSEEWNKLNENEKFNLVRTLTDIREGIGIPVKVKNEVLYHPSDLVTYLNEQFKTQEHLLLESLDGEQKVVIEGFIEGREFSCIVLQNELNTDGKSAIALPPTEIKKGKELFDYRSKYLPGLSRKITPIDLPEEQIEKIRTACEKLFHQFKFDVYARIDGFISKSGQVFLNDPNTTSGMMPSSFFFHQAAEIGLNPSQFLTYIIRISLQQRQIDMPGCLASARLMQQLDEAIAREKSERIQKIKVAVLLGGFSSERHISVESGRNIYEKLSSSTKYQPIPVFLTGNEQQHLMYQIPINILLKDNADDIGEKIRHYAIHPIVNKIINECSSITAEYAHEANLAKPQELTYTSLATVADAVFIALHGRPGEDGAVQQQLEKVGLPYNGSDAISSGITINKYQTNELLRKNNQLVAEHLVVKEEVWLADTGKAIADLTSKIKFPLIAKPVDDGCSSAVRKIKNEDELRAFADLIFRKDQALDEAKAALLKVKPKEEFPIKNEFLVEELISKNGAQHFLEITGGMLTHFDKEGRVSYEVFEPSEALSEGEVLSLEEKFLAGQGQNITPARFAKNEEVRNLISAQVKAELEKAARLLNINGYARIDAFVRIFENKKVEVIFIEVNSLPGMTPATCIFHQAAIDGLKPYDFIDGILNFAFQKFGKKLVIK